MAPRLLNRTLVRPTSRVLLVSTLVFLSCAGAKASKLTSSSEKAVRQTANDGLLPLSSGRIRSILLAGVPVSGTSTTTLSDGAVQTANFTAVPNPGAGSLTINKEISLATGGIEKVVDIATVSGKKLMETVTSTFPDGSVQTKNETLTRNGAATTINGTVAMPGGSVQSFTGQSAHQGTQTVTDLTVTNPGGKVYHDRITVVHQGSLTETVVNTIRGPHGLTSTVMSRTSTVLDTGGASSSTLAQTLTVPAPKASAQALNLEAQVIDSPSGSVNSSSAVQPAPVPEPSTLVIFGLLLGAVVVRRGRARSSQSSR